MDGPFLCACTFAQSEAHKDLDEGVFLWKNLAGLHRVLISNPLDHLWEELKWKRRARPPCLTSASDFTNVLLEEWSKIPINPLLNLVESLPRRVEAVRAATAGPTPY